MKILLFFILFTNLAFSSAFILNSNEKKYIKKQRTKNQIVNRFKNMYEFLNKAKQFNEIKKLNRTNSYINKIIGKSDLTNEWVSPKEFLIKGRGDCEDYAMTKYFVLKELNINTKRMYMSVVKKRGSKNFHMVLLYINKQNIAMVLDNLSWKLVPLNQRKDLIFKYAFNEKASYIFQNGNLVKEKNINRAEVKMFKDMLKKVNN